MTEQPTPKHAVEHEVPIIDLAAFRARAPGAREQTAARICESLERIGFFVITGHGVSDDIIRAGYAAAVEFFDQPNAVKAELAVIPGTLPRGYLPFGSVALGKTEGEDTPPDLKQSFALGPPAVHQPWPNMPDFRQSVTDLYHAFEGVMNDMLELFAAGINISPAFFHEKFQNHNSTLRLFDYPAMQQAPRPGQFRSGPHTDYGALTILSIGYDDPGGLQARNRRGEWVDVIAPPGSFVVNVGDLLMMWSNDRWLSNIHRVVLPADPARAMRRRQSIGFFANPRPDVLIECIPGCSDASNSAKHPPVLAGEHRLNKVRKSETHTQ